MPVFRFMIGVARLRRLFISLRNSINSGGFSFFMESEGSCNTSKNAERCRLFQRRIGKICLVAVLPNKFLMLIAFLIVEF